jgi:hypothetical protein
MKDLLDLRPHVTLGDSAERSTLIPCDGGIRFEMAGPDTVQGVTVWVESPFDDNCCESGEPIDMISSVSDGKVGSKWSSFRAWDSASLALATQRDSDFESISAFTVAIEQVELCQVLWYETAEGQAGKQVDKIWEGSITDIVRFNM